MRKLVNFKSNDIRYGSCPHCHKGPFFGLTDGGGRVVTHKCGQVDFTSREEAHNVDWRTLIMYWRLEVARLTLRLKSEHDWGYVTYLETDMTALTPHHKATAAVFNPRGVWRVLNLSDSRVEQYDAHKIGVISYSVPHSAVDAYMHLFDIRSIAAVWQRIADYVDKLYQVEPRPFRLWTLEADSDGWLYYDAAEFMDEEE